MEQTLVDLDEKIQFIYNFLRFAQSSYLIIVDSGMNGDTASAIFTGVNQITKNFPVLPVNHTIGKHTCQSHAFVVEEKMKIIITVDHLSEWMKRMIKEWDTKLVMFDSHSRRNSPEW